MGFEYNPVKDKAIAKHVAKRPDTAIASLIIEFKQPSTLITDIYKDKAVLQISDYLKEIAKKTESKMLEDILQMEQKGVLLHILMGKIIRKVFTP